MMTDTLLIALFVSLAVNVVFIRAWWTERKHRKHAEALMRVNLGKVARQVYQ